VPTAVYDFTTEGHFPEPPQVERIPTSLASPPVISQQVAVGEAAAMQGWRVQVFAGHSLEIAQSIQQELQVQRPEGVYLDYVEPYYKVRVGDCAARTTCEELLRELRSEGRQSAWVVASVIHR